MDATLAIAMLAATASFLLFGATVALLAVVAVLVWRNRSRARDLHAESTPVPPDRAEAPIAETLAPTSGPSPLASGGLIGFFDDESSVPGLDGGRTELFQPKNVPWVDDGEEGEATEIFSAHSAAGDLAEFAFDDGDDATGRFSKNG